jgi:hypothetical protein
MTKKDYLKKYKKVNNIVEKIRILINEQTFFEVKMIKFELNKKEVEKLNNIKEEIEELTEEVILCFIKNEEDDRIE